MKILIIDDDQEYANGISSVLESEEYVTKTTNSALDAIDLLDSESPELLIVDWQMPKMSGIELLKFIKSSPIHKSKYIIMLSGKSAIEDKVIGIDAGADDYLTKPFEPKELLARVRAGIRLIRMQNEIAEQERKNTVLEMALSITDKIGNPIAAARMLQQVIKMNINDPLKISQSIDDLGTVLLEAQELMQKYQSIKNPKTISAPLGKRMIDPDAG